MHSFTHPFPRTAGLLACAALGLSSLHAADAAKPAPDMDPLPVFENSITFAGQYNSVKGNEAAFQKQNWSAKNGFGGIQDFQFAQDLNDDVSVKADGYALFGNEDYLAHFNATKSEVGSVDVGFKRFRTYYDNAGGFFLPTASAWPGLLTSPEAMYVDRSKLWAQASLALPNAPIVTIRYVYEQRDGTKDSTVWGASDYTGLIAPGNGNVASRFIAPGYIDLNERHHLLEVFAKHSVGNTTFSLNVQGDRTDNYSIRYFDRYPGQLRMPTFATSGQNVNLNQPTSGDHEYGNETDAFSVIGKVETLLGDRAKVYAGFKYQHASSDFTEDRRLFTRVAYPTAAPVGVAIDPDADIANLVGDGTTKSYAANLGTELKIGPNLFADIGVKVEDRETESAAAYQTISSSVSSATGVVTIGAPANVATASRVDEKAVTPEISLRYTGFRTVSLYGTAERKYLDGEQWIHDRHNPNNPVSVEDQINSDIDEEHDRLTIGANWEPLSFLTVRTEVFYKEHQNDFNQVFGDPDEASRLFVLSYELKGAKVTATVRPLPTVSLTSRYIYQTGEMTTASTTRAEYQSGDVTIHQFGETIDWTPIKQFYMQGNLNVVFDTTSTAYPRAGGLANDILRNADNNYWTGSVLAGFVVDKVTNAEVQYTYYKADNYEPALLATALPYGAGQTDYSVTVGVKRKLTDRLVADVKVGYMNSQSDTTGGNTDYTARVAYVSLTQAF